jgi:hypothetical protein
MTRVLEDRFSTLAGLVEQGQQLDREIAAEALGAQREGVSVRAIGDALGVAPSTALEYLSRAAQKAGSATLDDVVIVAAKSAYDLYLRFGVYACQPRRTFRTAQWMGFYLDKTIQPEIPRILHIEPYIEYTDEWIQRLTVHGGPYDQQLANAVRDLRDSGARPAPGDPANNEIVILTPPEDDRSIALSRAIAHIGYGAGTRGQRYTSAAALRQSPATTVDLARLMRP